MKKLRKIFLISSSVLTLATIPAIAGTFLVTKTNNSHENNQINNFNALAATPATPVNFVSSPNDNYVSNSTIDSYFYSNNNTITSYSYGGAQQYTITLADSSATIISYNTFQLNGNTYIAILASNQTLYIYNNSNPITPTNTFDNINNQYNQIMFKDDSLFLYSSQFPTNILNSYTQINIQTLQVTNHTITNSISALDNVFIFKIVPLNSSYNMIIFANKPKPIDNEITSSLQFNNISYLIVQNDFTIPTGSSAINGITGTPTNLTNFATPLTYSQINIKFRLLASNSSSISNNIVIATPNAFIFVSDFLVSVQYIALPSNTISTTPTINDISSVVLSNSHAFFTIVGSNLIYKFSYLGFITTEFFDLTQMDSSFDVNNLSNYSLISTDSSTSLILVDSAKQNYYGITLGAFTSINIMPSFQVSLSTGPAQVNSTNTITALSSSLTSSNIIMSNSLDPKSTQTFNINNVNYLNFNLQNGTCTVDIFVSQVAWWDAKSTINSNIVITITNFESIQDFFNNSTYWISGTSFNDQLTKILSVNEITTADVQKIDPLDLSTLKQTNSYLSINPLITYTFTANSITNQLTVTAYITYTNQLSNVTQTINTTNIYTITSLSAPVFSVYGAIPGTNIIGIKQAIGLSNGLLSNDLANFLPSYAYRSSGDLSNNSSITNIQFFYRNFINTNLVVNIVPQPNDNTGQLTLTYIFSKPYLDPATNKNLSSVTYTYTGFNTYNDFQAEFQGQNIATNSNTGSTIDVTQVGAISSDVKNLSPYTLSTGDPLTSIINNDVEVSNSIVNQTDVTRYLSSFINSNLNLMNFTPTIINISAENPASLVKAMQDGTLSLELEYTGLTSEFASILGLTPLATNPSIYIKEVTFINLPKITTLANISLNSQGTDTIINDYDSGADINGEFEANVLKNITVTGYDIPKLTSQNVTMKWDGDNLDITIFPPTNQLITKYGALPSVYKLQISWAAKNAKIVAIIASSVTVSIIVLLIIIAIIAIWYYKKRTWLKKYF